MNIHEKNDCKFTNIYGWAHELSLFMASMSSKGLDRPLHSCSLPRACIAGIHKVWVYIDNDSD